MISAKIKYLSCLAIAGGCCWWLLVMVTSTTISTTGTSWLFSSSSRPFWTRAAEDKSNTGDKLAALLRPLLSDDAEVLVPGTPGFDQGTRTLAAKKPRLDLLVKVATAEDVQTTVCIFSFLNFFWACPPSGEGKRGEGKRPRHI